MLIIRSVCFANQVACDDQLGPSESIAKEKVTEEKVAEEKNDKDDPTQSAKHNRHSSIMCLLAQPSTSAMQPHGLSLSIGLVSGVLMLGREIPH